MQIKVHVTSDKTLKELKKLKSLWENWRHELEDVADYLERFLREDVFETEGGVYNRRWRPLSRSYELKKRVQYAGRGILEASGRMRKSWDRKIDAKNLWLWNTTDYAVYHQTGTRFMPKREMVAELPDHQIRHIENLFKQFIIRKIEQSA